MVRLRPQFRGAFPSATILLTGVQRVERGTERTRTAAHREDDRHGEHARPCPGQNPDMQQLARPEVQLAIIFSNEETFARDQWGADVRKTPRGGRMSVSPYGIGLTKRDIFGVAGSEWDSLVEVAAVEPILRELLKGVWELHECNTKIFQTRKLEVGFRLDFAMGVI